LTTRLGRLAVLSCLSLWPLVAIADADVWADSYDRTAGVRFIPVELWTGGAWDGSRVIAAKEADLRFGDRGQKSIAGPRPFVRPGTGETVSVYERVNGGKSQLFTITTRGDGIGRVYDSRYGRDCRDEVKFPLGLWHLGERRHFDIDCNGGALRRSIEVTIEQLDFTYRGIAHSLQFHWLADGGKSPGTDMHYVYSPSRGLVSEYGNE
jgi:hypothetical protein